MSDSVLSERIMSAVYFALEHDPLSLIGTHQVPLHHISCLAARFS